MLIGISYVNIDVYESSFKVLCVIHVFYICNIFGVNTSTKTKVFVKMLNFKTHLKVSEDTAQSPI